MKTNVKYKNKISCVDGEESSVGGVFYVFLHENGLGLLYHAIRDAGQERQQHSETKSETKFSLNI
jgi:hypothetical protein